MGKDNHFGALCDMLTTCVALERSEEWPGCRKRQEREDVLGSGRLLPFRHKKYLVVYSCRCQHGPDSYLLRCCQVAQWSEVQSSMPCINAIPLDGSLGLRPVKVALHSDGSCGAEKND